MRILVTGATGMIGCHAALVEAPATPDELARRLNLAAAVLAPELLDLEGAIHLERDGRYWVARRAADAGSP
jgi:nucleoside-diphosphate-sugar epimerase